MIKWLVQLSALMVAEVFIGASNALLAGARACSHVADRLTKWVGS